MKVGFSPDAFAKRADLFEKLTVSFWINDHRASAAADVGKDQRFHEDSFPGARGAYDMGVANAVGVPEFNGPEANESGIFFKAADYAPQKRQWARYTFKISSSGRLP